MNKKYRIILGKDPEFIPTVYWPDNYEDTEQFYKDYVEGEFSTDNGDLFWREMNNLVNNPLTMWYWVVIDGVLMVSGAIDPDDIFNLDPPKWVLDLYYLYYN